MLSLHLTVFLFIDHTCRVCPGRHIAEQSLFAVVILALSTLRIKPAVDENGIPTPPRVEMETGLVSSVI